MVTVYDNAGIWTRSKSNFTSSARGKEVRYYASPCPRVRVCKTIRYTTQYGKFEFFRVHAYYTVGRRVRFVTIAEWWVLPNIQISIVSYFCPPIRLKQSFVSSYLFDLHRAQDETIIDCIYVFISFWHFLVNFFFFQRCPSQATIFFTF